MGPSFLLSVLCRITCGGACTSPPAAAVSQEGAPGSSERGSERPERGLGPNAMTTFRSPVTAS
eukprot:3212709-Prymnesium_polylepis.1